VFTRRQLVDRLWGPDWFGDEHTIDMHVSRLRGKLGDDVRAPRFIQTVRGVGFRIAPAADGPTPGQKSGIRPEDRTEPT
jgi:DNA-binding response OmpR family regulator